MNFKKFHESRNLWAYQPDRVSSGVTVKWDGEKIVFSGICEGATNITSSINLPKGTYTLKANANRIPANNTYACIDVYKQNPYFQRDVKNNQAVNGTNTFTIDEDMTVTLRIRLDNGVNYDGFTLRPMLNVGEESLPYEPYSSEVWHDIPHYIHKTDTDILTTLPADIYANDTTATVGLKGDMEQSGTPMPTTPIQPSECGDLETDGAKAGQYKIPILSNSTTTNVYLGEVESTRRIKKLVLTGEETITEYTGYGAQHCFFVTVSAESPGVSLCSHYNYTDRLNSFIANNNSFMATNNTVRIHDDNYDTKEELSEFLAAQYAAGTPVTVWYVLATETTGIVNEPIRKIGDYADEVSGITIPTIAGANTIDIDTTLKPSEVSVNYKGWHPVQSVHEAENGQWD